ncbi:MAG: hypothetical protein GY870_13035, partial [archaeon]|nr:hypothetical protein [archaeon]
MDVMEFLKRNVQPATGCTEPIAVGYATALAFHSLFNDLTEFDGSGDFNFKNKLPIVEIDKIKKISIKTDRDVYKNALAVVIPGTGGLRGILIAAAMGLYCDPRNKLNIFSNISPDIVENAKKIIEMNKILIEKVTDMGDKPKLDINVTIEYAFGDKIDIVKVRLQDNHTNVTQININDRIVYGGSRITKNEEYIFPESIEEYIKIIQSLTQQEKNEIYKGVIMNKKIAEYGIKEDIGLGIGKALQKMSIKTKSESGKSLIDEVKIIAAAAADARMGGALLPVMSTGGSGNQGITAIIPIAVVGEIEKKSKDKICEAVMLSHLIVSLSKKYSGDLSAI